MPPQMLTLQTPPSHALVPVHTQLDVQLAMLAHLSCSSRRGGGGGEIGPLRADGRPEAQVSALRTSALPRPIK